MEVEEFDVKLQHFEGATDELGGANFRIYWKLLMEGVPHFDVGVGRFESSSKVKVQQFDGASEQLGGGQFPMLRVKLRK